MDISRFLYGIELVLGLELMGNTYLSWVRKTLTLIDVFLSGF